jgi:hypothetical protein
VTAGGGRGRGRRDHPVARQCCYKTASNCWTSRKKRIYIPAGASIPQQEILRRFLCPDFFKDYPVDERIIRML